VDPNREFIPDHRNGDLLAKLLAERAVEDRSVKEELIRLANGDLPPAKRMLLVKVFGHFTGEENLVEGLNVLRDEGFGVTYELVRLFENVFLEQRPYSSHLLYAPYGNAAHRMLRLLRKLA
jgi:hypothetical protein